MQDRARKKGRGLAIENGKFFVRIARKIGWDSAPTKEELMALPAKYGWKLKRKTLRGQKAAWRGAGDAPLWLEVERRIKARGTFAKGWRFMRFEASGTRIRIWIQNTVGYADTINERDNTAPKAAVYVAKVFQRKLTSLAKELTDGFGK